MSRPNLDEIPPGLLRLRANLHQQSCWLFHYGGCRGHITAQHLISRGRTIKSPEARAACEWLLVPVCYGHNIGRMADAGWARRVLAKRLAEVVGEDWLRAYVDAIPWKVPRPELSWKGIMSAPEYSDLTGG
mgnify:CR=1 FL=1